MAAQPNSAGEVEDVRGLTPTPDVGGDLPDPDQSPAADLEGDGTGAPAPGQAHRRVTPAAARRARVLATAAAEIGTKEAPPGSNRVKYTAWYGLVGAWCDMFQAWVADQTGLTDVLGRFAYTPSHATWFRHRGQWHAGGPQVGDLAFFDFGLGRISHVGLVERVLPDGLIHTIEGNTDVAGGRTGGRVMRKSRRTSLVVGYGRPDYAAGGDVHVSGITDTTTATTDPQSNPKIAAWQALLAFAPARRDGVWGADTDQRSQWMATAARTKAGTLSGSATSTVRLVQRVIGTPDDGAWGPASRAAMTRWIRRAQTFLGVEPDGDWGPVTEAAYERLRPG